MSEEKVNISKEILENVDEETRKKILKDIKFFKKYTDKERLRAILFFLKNHPLKRATFSEILDHFPLANIQIRILVRCLVILEVVDAKMFGRKIMYVPGDEERIKMVMDYGIF